MLQILLLLGVTATSSVIHAEQDVPLPLVCDIESCSRDSFCGIDGVCRPKSCENYYEFGNRTFTGYNEIDPVPLDCSSIPETILNDGVTSLTFRCSSMMTQPFISHGYNRKCTAITPKVSSFECYSIDPSTDFSRFLRLPKQNPSIVALATRRLFLLTWQSPNGIAAANPTSVSARPTTSPMSLIPTPRCKEPFLPTSLYIRRNPPQRRPQRRPRSIHQSRDPLGQASPFLLCLPSRDSPWLHRVRPLEPK